MNPDSRARTFRSALFSRKFLFLAGILLLAALALYRWEATRPAGAGTLDNGVRYRVVAQHSTDHRILVRLRMNVGAENETAGESGISHFLEHMAFNGAGEFGPNDINKWLTAHGLALGKDQNASTNYGETNYQLSVPENDPAALATAIRFLGAVAAQMHLDEAMIDRERPIIFSEMELRDTPEARATTSNTSFSSNGRTLTTPVIGTHATVSSFHRQQLLDYYRRWYRPERASIVVAGNVNTASVAAQIQAVFGSWHAATPDAPQVASHPAPETTAPQLSVFHDAALSSTSILLTRQEPLPSGTDAQLLESDLLSRLVTDVLEHRLELLREQGTLPASSVGVTRGPVLQERQETDVEIASLPGRWNDGLATAWHELDRIRGLGIERGELDQARLDVLRDLQNEAAEFQQGTSTGQAGAVMDTLRSSTGATDPADRLARARSLLQRLDVASANAFIKEHLAAAGWHIAVNTPATGADAPTQVAIQQTIDSTRGAALTAWQPDQSVTSILRTEPLAPRTPDSTVDRELAITSTDLPNHIVVHYRRMAEASKEITLVVALSGGEMQEDAQNRGITQLVATGLNNLSTDHLTTAQISGWLQAHGMTWEVGTEREQVVLKLTTAPDQLTDAFRFLHLVLTQARLQDNDVTQWRSEFGDLIARQQADPVSLCAEKVKARLYGGDPRFNLVPAAQLQRLTREQGQAWMDGLLRHAFSEVGIAGNVPASRVISLAARYLGSVGGHAADPAPLQNMADLSRLNGPQADTCTSSGNKAAAALVFRSASLRNLHDFYGLQFLSRVLQARLFAELREKEGLSYQIQTSAESGVNWPDGGFLVIAFSSSTEDVQRGLETCRKIVNDLATQGPTDAEIRSTMAQILNQIEQGRTQPEHWARRLSQMRTSGFTMADLKTPADNYRSVGNRPELTRLLHEYFSPRREFSAVARPMTSNSSVTKALPL